jgi:putative ABC transport system permease protein
MRLSSVLLLHRVRLRTRWVQELFAVVGIAVGVALLFASQVASTSLDSSVQQLTKGIVGAMRFQLTARGPEGFDQRLLGRVQSLPGVRAAEPVLEAHANVIGPRGERAVDLIGTDPRFARLGGPLLRHFTAAQLAHSQAFALPAPLAQSIGLLSLQSVNLQIGAHMVQGFLGAELLESDIGPLVDSPVALAPLAYAQQLADMPERVSRIFVQPMPGRDGEVQEGLIRLAAGQLDVRPADFDATLFSQAAGSANQSAVLFSAISALVGFLFAFNAILLTIPQRRHLVEDLRLDGYPRWAVVEVLLFDALVLGVLATLLGLVLGDLVSLVVFHANPGYLSFAFPVGSQRIVTWRSIAIAACGGLLASCVAVLLPLARDISSRLSLASVARAPGRMGTTGALAGGLVCLTITTVILFVLPQAAIFGIATLVLAALLLLQPLVFGIVFLFDRLQRLLPGVAAYLAVVELRSTLTQTRSLAIAATGTIAVLGSVAIQGAHANLQRGLDNATRDVNVIADVWASPAGASNLLATTPFSATATKRLAGLPGVRSVALYRGSFLDYGGRRTWVIAPPRTAEEPVPPSQILSGNLALADRLIGRGGWVVLSSVIASEHHLHIGQSFTLPSPRPTTFRVAALSTNIGWPPGAIILNAEDYARAWGSTAASAYNVTVAPNFSPRRVSREMQRALGAESGLSVETMRQRELRGYATSRQGLSRLTQISTLVLIAAILAMASAMGSMIWQRRDRLADMKVDGFSRGILWRALLGESVLLLGAGCSVGALFGIYGQLLLSHALATVTGFPVVYSTAGLVAAGSFLLVVTVAVVIVALPGYLAVRVRPAIGLQD